MTGNVTVRKVWINIPIEALFVWTCINFEIALALKEDQMFFKSI